MTYSSIIGTGSYVPEKTLTNAELEKLVDTNDEWIMKRVGVKSRYVIGDSQDNTSTMAVAAAQKAIAAADIDPDIIDLIVVATATPEYYFPSTACIVQQALGLQADVPAFDLNAACAGFIYGLSIADQYIRSGAAGTVLVIGTEALTKLVDWTDRSTCVLFGDGAGAILLQAADKPGVYLTKIHANGQYNQLIGAHNSIWHEGESPYLWMKGAEVFKTAVTKLGDIVEQTVAKSGLSKSDIDWLIPHQANFRIIKATAKRLGLPLEKVILTIEEHGNTSAASVPLALDDAIRIGKIKRGDVLLLEAFGAGLAWGSALIKY